MSERKLRGDGCSERVQRRKAAWQNVVSLTKILWSQQRSMLLILFLILFVGTLGFYVVDLCLRCLNQIDYTVFHVYRGVALLVVGGVIFCGGAASILMNDQIGVYPGNAVTRLLARMLVDHGQIVLYTLMAGGMYLFQGVCAFLVSLVFPVNMRYAFDVRYLGQGMLQMLCYLLTAYGIFMLIYAVLVRLGKGFFIASVVFLLVGYRHVPLVTERIWQWADAFLFTSQWGTFVRTALGIWLLCQILTVGVAFTMKGWKKNDGSMGLFMAVLVYGAVICFWNTSDWDGRMEWQDTMTSILASRALQVQKQIDLVGMEEDGLTAFEPENIECIDKTKGTVYGAWSDVAEGNSYMEYLSVKEARQEGIPFDETAVEEGKALLVYSIEDRKIKGESLWQELAGDLEQGLHYDRASGKLQYRMTCKSIFLNQYFGDTTRPTKGRGVAAMERENLLRMKGALILHDNDIERYLEGTE